MKERMDKFAKDLAKKKHLSQLLKNLDLCLAIETEMEKDCTFYLYLQRNKIEVREDDSLPAGSRATIKGAKKQLVSLLDGEIKLREGIEIHYFKMFCPFRTLLTLESLFYLGRPLSAQENLSEKLNNN